MVEISKFLSKKTMSFFLYIWNFEISIKALVFLKMDLGKTCIWIKFLTDLYALSFYRSKFILERPNRRVQIFLVGSKSFWSDTIHFSQVWIWFLWIIFFNLDLFKMIWTCSKWFGPDQNKLDPAKMIGARPKWFGWSSPIILDPLKDKAFVN